MKINKISKKIPTLRVSKNLLNELCNIIDTEYHNAKPKNDSEFNPTFEFSNKDVTITENKSKPFIESLPKSIGDVHLTLKIENKSIDINIDDTDIFGWNRFSIYGEEPTWVFGISKQIEQIFEKYKTKNYLFYTKKANGIYALCSLGLFFVAFLAIINSGFEPEKGDVVVSAGIFSVMIALLSWGFLWPSIFKKVFTILEIENSQQVKLKRMLPFLIIGIISSLVGGLMLLLVKII